MQAGSSDASMSSWRVFATDMKVRPDDLDFFQHVHASRYQDYVLAARFDQMERCYGLSMQTFLEKGLGWYVKEFHICLLYTSPSPRDATLSRMPSSA